MGGASALTEAGTAPVEFFREKGIDVSTPEGAAMVIRDPDLMRQAVERGDVRGLVVGLMDGLSGGVASRTLLKSPVGNMVVQALTQAAMGAGGEAGAQVLSGQQINLGNIILDGLAEFATAPVEVAAMGSSRLMDRARKAKSAADRKVLFEQLSGQAQSSALRARLPDRFRQFVEAATANGPVENVYVPADQFVQYFQSIGADPHAIVDELEGVARDDLDTALAGGGDLQIPTATYAAKIAGSEHDAFLMENKPIGGDMSRQRLFELRRHLIEPIAQGKGLVLNAGRELLGLCHELLSIELWCGRKPSQFLFVRVVLMLARRWLGLDLERGG